jgi:dolichol-phosphate mannosyltransferase
MSVDVSVVFPTYNEAENIVTLIRRTDNALQNYNREIIVMDDDSPDKTWLLAQNEKNPRVKVVRRINKRKLVTAIQEGIDAANGKVVVWMDADLSMPPELIPKLLARMNRADIVVGSRYAPGGRDKRPLLRVLSSRFINTIANLVLNFNVLDYDSGFVAAKKEVFSKLRLNDSGYGEYCIEFLFHAGKKGYKIKEVGYAFTDRRAGESKTAESLYGLFKYGMMYLHKIFSLRFGSRKK